MYWVLLVFVVVSRIIWFNDMIYANAYMIEYYYLIMFFVCMVSLPLL